MDKYTAPAELLYRSDRDSIVAQAEAAKAFAEEVKAAALAAEKAAYVAQGHTEMPERYFDLAAAQLKIGHRVDYEGSYSYATKSRKHFHVWTVPGSFRNGMWGETKMVIRKDRTLNTEYLCYAIRMKAYRLWEADENERKQREVAEVFAAGAPALPNDYIAEPTSEGVRVQYTGEGRYTRATTLNAIVKPGAVAGLIDSHQKWVAAYMAFTSK